MVNGEKKIPIRGHFPYVIPIKSIHDALHDSLTPTRES